MWIDLGISLGIAGEGEEVMRHEACDIPSNLQPCWGSFSLGLWLPEEIKGGLKCGCIVNSSHYDNLNTRLLFSHLSHV